MCCYTNYVSHPPIFMRILDYRIKKMLYGNAKIRINSLHVHRLCTLRRDNFQQTDLVHSIYKLLWS